MRIVLSGIETTNKGAELMLYAILQEIERKHPKAEVYIPLYAIKQGLNYMKTNVKLLGKPFAKMKMLARSLHLIGVLRRLHLPYYFFEDFYPVNNIDYFIDASGFGFTDQWNPSDRMVDTWEKQLRNYSEQGAKIIFLPQAFGPVELPNTKRELSILNRYATIIMPRDRISYDYLQKCGMDMSKVKLFMDFTSLVDGEIPVMYRHLNGGICIIPNMRMIDKGKVSFESYLTFLTSVIDIGMSKGYKVYLLNHEGREDEYLAYRCKEKVNNCIDVVTGLNALEVKGLISTSYLCISSRFHGAASALNSCVPCLATSWSHKYAELFKDYSMNDSVLDLMNIEDGLALINNYIDTDNNYKIRETLKLQLPIIQENAKKMWEYVWK